MVILLGIRFFLVIIISVNRITRIICPEGMQMMSVAVFAMLAHTTTAFVVESITTR